MLYCVLHLAGEHEVDASRILPSQELEVLEEDAQVFKLIGPVLVKQELVEVRNNVTKRLEYIKSDMCAAVPYPRFWSAASRTPVHAYPRRRRALVSPTDRCSSCTQTNAYIWSWQQETGGKREKEGAGD